jgi:septum formation protein
VKLPPLILASQSPRRVELLRQIIPEFHVAPSYATELHDLSLGTRRLCEVNAERKALSVAERYPDHLVLGADTLVFLDGDGLAKPADLDEAKTMLRRLSGRVHEVITGVCLVHQRAARMVLLAEVTHVKFLTLTDAAIGEYLRRVEVLDKAGAYAVQEHGDLIIERVEGSFSNVVGLPVEAVRRVLEHWDNGNGHFASPQKP